MQIFSRIFLCLILLTLTISGCKKEVTEKEVVEKKAEITIIVFKHGKIAGDPQALADIIADFEKQNPDIKVIDEQLPASTDEQHQFYAINLAGKASEFDVISMDVIWVPEFARAGWLMDISSALPIEERIEFFPGPMDAVTYKERIYAIPWYIDAGVLYYRKDLLQKYGFYPPQTWDELLKTSKIITAKEKDLYGFIWQGKQYEGLVCNVLEYFWSNGGDVLWDDSVVINSPENIESLQFMQDLIFKHKISPELVLTSIEEPTRHIFGNGKALFMRNWPYAWNIFNKEGSPVRGNVGVSDLPFFKGHKTASTLGGWQLGINKFSKHPEAAEKFIKYLTSPPVQKKLAITIGYKPTRKSLYKDEDLLREQPFIVGLYNVFLHAKPRPVSPYYMAMTQLMQPEFSAAISGIKTPEQALKTIQTGFEKILKGHNP
ncbi:MAG: ABC transporter substrate-binding protein [Thermodesulfovibrionia bacterium]|nr:ABC transporter substrate-binding protein [Thermodesulfovibrionia bacterium]